LLIYFTRYKNREKKVCRARSIGIASRRHEPISTHGGWRRQRQRPTPPWVIFEHYCTLEVQGCSSSIADTNTLARCRTTAGHPINVSLCLAAPPEGSRVCVQLPAGIVTPYAAVLAAHGDSVVVQVGPIEDRRTLFGTNSTDHFVYSAGDAAAEPPRLPSLSQLSPHSITYEDEERARGVPDVATWTLTAPASCAVARAISWWRSSRWSVREGKGRQGAQGGHAPPAPVRFL
jgi:hypothetical protein